MSSFTINEKYPCVGSGHCVLHNVKLMIMSVHTSEYKQRKQRVNSQIFLGARLWVTIPVFYWSIKDGKQIKRDKQRKFGVILVNLILFGLKNLPCSSPTLPCDSQILNLFPESQSKLDLRSSFFQVWSKIERKIVFIRNICICFYSSKFRILNINNQKEVF